jgi:hypothetical protein
MLHIKHGHWIDLIDLTLSAIAFISQSETTVLANEDGNHVDPEPGRYQPSATKVLTRATGTYLPASIHLRVAATLFATQS